jgi:RNA polymerase sigma-70 factor (ECF subfamily)
MAAVSDPAFSYEAHEHIAYCFTCVGRSLEPDAQAVLVAREVLGLSNLETARAVGISESLVRHRLSAARQQMTERFDGLCSLVNKNGVCYQCSGLREIAPPQRQGAPVPAIRNLDDRIAIVREADVDNGASQPMHDIFWRRTAELEAEGRGSEAVATACGRPPADAE